MIKLLLILLFFQASVLSVYAGGGDDHTHAAEPIATTAPAGVANTDVFVANAVSENFEAVLKYQPIEPGKVAALRLYLSDFYTNEPLKATIKVDANESGVSLKAPATVSPGIYLLSGTFAEKKSSSLTVEVTATGKTEYVSFPVQAGKEIPAEDSPAAVEEGFDWTVIFMIIGGVLLLGLLAFFLKRKNLTVIKSKFTEVVKTTDNKTIAIITFILIGAASIGYTFKATAHGGEDHGENQTPAPPPGSDLAMPKETQFLLGVRTVLSDDGLLSRGVNVTGKVIPTTQGKAEVSAPLVGIIAANSSIPAIGSFVRKGQVLAVLQQTLAASERISATTELIGLKSNLMLAQRELERLKQLRRFISQKEIEIAEAEVKTARQAITSYEQLISGTGASRFEIVAPVSGVITMADVTRGEQVEAGKTLFEITDLGSVWVEAQVSELDIAAIQQTRAASFTVPAYPGEIFYGTLFTVGNVLDEQSRTVQAIFTVNNSARLLKIGMIANVTIDVGDKGTAILVPKDAIVDISGKPTVFIHTEPEVFVPQAVSVGTTDGKMVEITSGLDAGARVVVSGNAQLKRIMLGI